MLGGRFPETGPERGGESLAERSQDGLDAAARRLDAALDALEAAIHRQRAGERSLASLRGELQLMAEDRSRLAEQLDAAQDRIARLEAARDEASRRLDAAMETIRAMLQSAEG